MPSRLTVLSGPSGVGKGTVVAAVAPALPAHLGLASRAPPGRRGRGSATASNTASSTASEFHAMVDAGEFLEHAEFAGNLYGTPRGPVLERLAAGAAGAAGDRAAGRPAGPRRACRTPCSSSWPRRPGRNWSAGSPPGAPSPPEVIERRLARAEVEMAAEAEFDEPWS